ncbi:MAG: ParB/RepB/Spo0J family partition protein [Betaproteobacteria bacterium]
MSQTKTKGLGRGLDALLGADLPAANPGGAAGAATLPLGQLQPGRYQPRTRMDETALQELADSIRVHGLMQPIVVRGLGASRWEIIAGERRFRAARLAGLTEVPVIVRDVSDEQALALALIEHIQREDLNPLEEAQAIRRLLSEFGYTHEQAAEAIGRSRSATSNLLRLLALAEPVQTMLLAGDIEMGHARALLALPAARQTLAASERHARRLSLREAERLAARHAAEAAGTSAGASRAKRAAERPQRDLARLEERLSDLLGTRVELRARARGAGALTVHFADPAHFESILTRLALSAALEE